MPNPWERTYDKPWNASYEGGTAAPQASTPTVPQPQDQSNSRAEADRKIATQLGYSYDRISRHKDYYPGALLDVYEKGPGNAILGGVEYTKNRMLAPVGAAIHGATAPARFVTEQGRKAMHSLGMSDDDDFEFNNALDAIAEAGFRDNPQRAKVPVIGDPAELAGSMAVPIKGAKAATTLGKVLTGGGVAALTAAIQPEGVGSVDSSDDYVQRKLTNMGLAAGTGGAGTLALEKVLIPAISKSLNALAPYYNQGADAFEGALRKMFPGIDDEAVASARQLIAEAEQETAKLGEMANKVKKGESASSNYSSATPVAAQAQRVADAQKIAANAPLQRQIIPRMGESKVPTNVGNIRKDLLDALEGSGEDINRIKAIAGGQGKRSKEATQLMQDIAEGRGQAGVELKNSLRTQKLFTAEEIDNMFGNRDRLAKDVKVDPKTTIAVLDRRIAELSDPNLRSAWPESEHMLTKLKEMRQNLSNGPREVPSTILDMQGNTMTKTVMDDPFSYQKISNTRSSVGSDLRDYYKGKNSVLGEKDTVVLTELKDALSKDLSDAASAKGGALAKADKAANEAYRKYSQTYRGESSIRKAMETSTPDEVLNLFVKAKNLGGGDATKILADNLTPQGLRAARVMAIEKMYNMASDEMGDVVPKKFVKIHNGMDESLKVLFPKGGEEYWKLEGLNKLMHTAHNSSLAVTGAAGAGAFSFSHNPALMTLGAAGGISSNHYLSGDRMAQIFLKAYENPKTSKWLLQASDLKEGSPALQKILEEVLAQTPKAVGAKTGKGGKSVDLSSEE